MKYVIFHVSKNVKLAHLCQAVSCSLNEALKISSFCYSQDEGVSSSLSIWLKSPHLLSNPHLLVKMNKYWPLPILRPSCLPHDHMLLTGFRKMPKSAHKAWISIRQNLISDPLWERFDLFLTVSAAIKPQLCITGWKIRSSVPEQIQHFVHHELNHRSPN